MANPDVNVANAPAALKGSFPGDLGLELVEIEDERVTARLMIDRRHLHPGGYVHGGVWVAFADTLAAWGTMRNLSEVRVTKEDRLAANFICTQMVL